MISTLVSPQNRAHETTIQTADGLQLHVRWWPLDGNAKAVIALVHGAAEHVGRYAKLVAALNERGYAVAGFDLRGHGRSEGPRLLVRSFDRYVDDAERFLQHVSDELPGRPLFVFGHSMGGMIATLLVLTRQPNTEGLILSGPVLQVGEHFSSLTIRLAKLLGRLLPGLPLDRVNPEDLSRDESVVRTYEADPLVHHGWIPAGTGAAVIRAIQRIEREEISLQVPLLLLHGTADKLASVEGSKRLYRNAASHDKTLKLYEGYYHEVLNERGKDDVLADLLSWLEERTA